VVQGLWEPRGDVTQGCLASSPVNIPPSTHGHSASRQAHGPNPYALMTLNAQGLARGR